MNLLQIFRIIQDNSVGAVIIGMILATVIQIAPIQINPWSHVIHFISSIFNRDICNKIDRMDEKIDGLESRVMKLNSNLATMKDDSDESRAVTARIRILRFADELLSGQKHSKDSFDATLTDIDYYEKYCLEHPTFKNNQTVMSVKHIKNAYEKHLSNHDFLY